MRSRFDSRSPEETRALARRLAVEAPRDELALLVLTGPLGAGKTVVAKGLAEGVGIDARAVTSPTFVIASEYEAARPFVHVDVYRLGSEAELEAAGLLDWLRPGALVAIEWGERFRDALPTDRVELRFEPAATPEARRLELEAFGAGARAWLDRVATAWSESRAPDAPGSPEGGSSGVPPRGRRSS